MISSLAEEHIQGDPNQNLLLQMVITLKICISDPIHARVQNGQYNRVTPPDTYSPINPPAYGGVQTNSDDDAGEDV